MAKKMLIDATHPEETRVVVVDGNKVEEFDFESENKRQLAGNIYLAKVTRVEPSLQAAFVDYGGNRHGFLAFSEIHPDYYQIPVADREALMAEERAYAKAQAEQADKEENEKPKRRRSRSRAKPKAAKTDGDDAVVTKDVEGSPSGMDVIDLNDDAASEVEEGLSPMETAKETPVEEPENGDAQAAAEEGKPEQAQADAGEQKAEEEPQVADETAVEAAEAVEVAEEGDADDAPEAKLAPSEKDDQIESVADEDVTEEIRQPRKRRPKKYKIQEVVKVRQILLVQVVKEERGNKGAALTTYLSLAGRYCVLMPNTARGGGISRKITNAADRKKLKAIANEIDVPEGAGLIVRTAGAKRTKTEIKRDYEYLQRLWEQIRALTLKSIAPAKIYEEGNLIKRSIRDLYNREIDEVLVEGPAGYRVAKDHMKMIMPSHAKNVKQYTDAMPLLARFQVESYLSSMFNPTVQLRSGGYIVIDVTEALVAIDVNSGRATKEGSIEDTATKTNLEAAEEVARQLRLRDLAGLIVIDFIDMEERRNNNAVEKRLKDKLKTDRARIQVGRISGFGLMEMSRQRLRPGMIEATTQPCNHCHGTGLVRSDDNLALNILRQLEEEGVRKRSRELLLKAPVGIVNFLINNKREHIAQIEARYGLSIRVEADPFLISPDFAIEKFKTATRKVPEASAAVVSVDAALMSEIDEAEEVAEETAETTADTTVDSGEAPRPKKRRRRRRRRRPSGGGQEEVSTEAGTSSPEGAADTPKEAPVEAEAASGDTPAEPAQSAEVKEEKPKRAPRRRSRKKTEDAGEATAEAPAAPEVAAEVEEKPKRATRSRKKAAPKVEAAEEKAAPAAEAEVEIRAEVETKAETKPKTTRKRRTPKKVAEPEVEDAAEAPKKPTRKRAPAKKKVEPTPEITAEPVAEPAREPAPAPEPVPEPVAVEAAAPKEVKPKKKGWWSLGS
ncbi:MAG: Rne/Rng family ribonuclease [Rhodobacteraceae bacterium]|nr:Rne/Rng family ribonuclease [Paracoccaceae bacterium]